MTGPGGKPSPLRVVIVDDEPPARDLLAQYLETCDDVEIVGQCGDGFEAVKVVSELAPDVLLLDIQMPKLDGFEVLELLDERPQVVFTTAHDEYALKAFEVAAVDYLLKPIDPARLAEALERVRERLAKGEQQRLDDVLGARAGGAIVDRILVREGSSVHVLDPRDVDYVEAQDDYVVVHAGGRELRKKQTLGRMEERLGPRFVRIHRGVLLNLDRLRHIEPYARDSRVAFLEDGTRLPVSRSGYERLRRLL